MISLFIKADSAPIFCKKVTRLWDGKGTDGDDDNNNSTPCQLGAFSKVHIRKQNSHSQYQYCCTSFMCQYAEYRHCQRNKGAGQVNHSEHDKVYERSKKNSIHSFLDLF